MVNKKSGDTTRTLIYVEDKITLQTLQSDAPPLPDHPLAEALDDFMQRIDDIVLAAKTMVPASAKILKHRSELVSKKLDEAEEKIKSGTPAEASHAGASIVEASHEAERIYRSRLPEIVEKSLFVNLFSEYDHFFGIILRELYRMRPDLLASLSKQISFEELIKFEHIDAVKNAVLEAEIDTIRRESYVEQFSILQKKFGLPLTKFQEWPQFVEAGQRRNLMVHCGGHVSDQYLQASEASGYKFVERPLSGQKLEIGYEYFSATASLVSRVGLMLTHTLWRKVLPTEAEMANDELNDQVYKLLCAKRWKTAADIGAFSLSEVMLAGTTDMQHRIRLCNTAIALKNLKQAEDMNKLLSSIDWTASIRDFRFAVAILQDRRPDAISFMKQIGKKGELVHDVAYHQWPLFGGFRELPEFHSAYEEIYGYPFYLKAEKSAEEARSRLEQAIEQTSPDHDNVPEPSRSAPAKKTIRPKRIKKAEEQPQLKVVQASPSKNETIESAQHASAKRKVKTKRPP